MVFYAGMAIAAVFSLVFFISITNFIQLWLQAFLSGAYVNLGSLVGMRLRKVRPATIVLARISAMKAGIDLSVNELEAHYLAGGNVPRVVQAMIAASKSDLDLSFEEVTALDLSGEDVLAVVQNARMCSRTAEVDGQPYETHTDGSAVAVGTLLRVTRVEGGVLTLETVAQPDAV